MPPMPPDFLQQLLARRDTWWGRESTGTGQGQSTGFNDLDQILAGGGWPEQGLVELLCPLPCPAVLHLLLPVLASDGPGARLIANPPMRPSATMLARAGVPLDDLLILRSDDRATLLRASFEAIARSITIRHRSILNTPSFLFNIPYTICFKLYTRKVITM